MRATKAYIASLGTTGVLLAASLLMLAVVSAVVAFDRWPDGRVSSRVQTLVLAERPAPIRVTDRAVAAATASARASSTAAASGTVAPAHGVAGVRFSGGHPTSGTTPTAPRTATPGLPALPKPPQLPSAPNIPDLISNPGTTAGQVADGAQSVTDAAGVSVAKISPDLGNTVSTAGQSAADTIRQVPLPGHLIPGH